jgi:MerR family transcriptional regulator, light-induced transcriptional regulator
MDEPAANNCEFLSRRFLDALLKADRGAALRVVIDEGVKRGVGVARLVMDVIRPAQHEIGQLWQMNKITVADEHVATAISQLALAQLYPYAERPAPTGRRILMACVEGEQHDMGARMAADLLDLDGHDVIFLGASVPTDHLILKCAAGRFDLVVLSITMTFHVAALIGAIERLQTEVQPPPAIAAGGRALGWCPELPARLKLAAHGEDARTLISDVQRFFSR